MIKTVQSVDLKPIERLAEKVTGLVGLLEQTRAELTRSAEDNNQLKREVESLSERLAAAENEGAETKTLLDEREQIRIRVSEMLEQLETLNV
jgi:cell shape-determining protein MreC